MNILKPRVAILIATYNGLLWLPTQVNTILSQIGVDVRLYFSDDGSEDGTDLWIEGLAKDESRVVLLPRLEKTGSAGKNFYRLLLDVNANDFDFISFSDQDDIWNQDKLINHVKLLKENHSDGVSSNVLAFWESSKVKLIHKSKPQKNLDYLFESAGPGCTFLMTPALVNKVKKELSDPKSPAKEVFLHDWLTYAICRAHGGRWIVDPIPSLNYRQHQSNIVGANVGLKAKLARVIKVRQHWYRNEILKISTVCARISNDKETENILMLLNQYGFVSRVKLLCYVKEARRSFLDRVMLALAIVVGIF